MSKVKEIECFLLDMDGTIYLGQQLIKGARRFIDFLLQSDKEFVFLTNNSSKNSDNYQKKLKKLGIEVPLERIITSGEVTASYIKERKSNPVVYLVGTPALKKYFQDNNIKIINEKQVKAKVEVDYLVVAFDTTLNYQKLWTAHNLLIQGIDYLATNPDKVCPLEDGATMPDCGAIMQLLKTSTGRMPLVIGKPNSLMIDYVAQKTGINKEKMALVGDRLYTDMKMAENADIKSILVLSGETHKKDLTINSTVKPDFVFPSVLNIYQELVKK